MFDSHDIYRPTKVFERDKSFFSDFFLDFLVKSRYINFLILGVSLILISEIGRAHQSPNNFSYHFLTKRLF